MNKIGKIKKEKYSIIDKILFSNYLPFVMAGLLMLTLILMSLYMFFDMKTRVDLYNQALNCLRYNMEQARINSTLRCLG